MAELQWIPTSTSQEEQVFKEEYKQPTSRAKSLYQNWQRNKMYYPRMKDLICTNQSLRYQWFLKTFHWYSVWGVTVEKMVSVKSRAHQPFFSKLINKRQVKQTENNAELSHGVWAWDEDGDIGLGEKENLRNIEHLSKHWHIEIAHYKCCKVKAMKHRRILKR